MAVDSEIWHMKAVSVTENSNETREVNPGEEKMADNPYGRHDADHGGMQ
ncbi:hypothetical protein J14TS5_18980 [Paenibacillus lautus]|nr:hypothetical protein J14TS5_18980 [Paenibacillus lautus]